MNITDLTLSHAEMIKHLVDEHAPNFPDQPVFVETGSGMSTLGLAAAGQKCNAKMYSCDYNQDKVNGLLAKTKNKLDNVEFLVGDSVKSLTTLAQRHGEFHFLHLDSAGSAMHTFREFMAIESYLKPGTCLLIDNAALPGATGMLSDVRKGKILVPYLLASDHWDVFIHPKSGSSMVSATFRSEADFAEPDYELQGWVDEWATHFENQL